MKAILNDFAEILDYPAPGLSEKVKGCIGRISGMHEEPAHLLNVFQQFLEQNEDGTLEELYTGTFELQGCCNLYVGHYLFGEDYRRSLFMIKLKEHYREQNFAFEKELPDHLCVLLRFLSNARPRADNDELIRDCIIPAVTAMVKSFPSKHHPYRAALQSLLLVLQEGTKENPSGEAERDA